MNRNKDGVDNTFFPEYRIAFDDVNILYAKKTMKGYDIMLDPATQLGSTTKLATVKGNFVGSCYNVYEG